MVVVLAAVFESCTSFFIQTAASHRNGPQPFHPKYMSVIAEDARPELFVRPRAHFIVGQGADR